MLEHYIEKMRNTLQKLESLTVSLENIDFGNLENEEMVKARDTIFYDLTKCKYCMIETHQHLEYLISDIECNLKKMETK